MKPDWDKLMDAFSNHPSKMAGDVDCTAPGGKDICEKLDVQSFPTLKVRTGHACALSRLISPCPMWPLACQRPPPPAAAALLPSFLLFRASSLA